MTGPRRLALAILGVAAAAAGALALAVRQPQSLPPRAPDERPVLLLLTSLPLIFGDDFSLDGGGSPAIAALDARYAVTPISTAEPAELAKGKLLLMAHPPAQSASDLVALDRWVRGGGRVLLLADPMLEWPSERPLGDPLRPAPMFMDTGLLRHWGLRLDAPDRRGPTPRQVGGLTVETESPGSLFGQCAIGADRLVARCRIGKGEAFVVADADFLNGPAINPGVDALIRLLSDLERK